MTASGKINRRNFLKGIGVVPVSMAAPVKFESRKKSTGKTSVHSTKISLGLIGFGFRGEQLARAMKFAHPDWIQEQETKEKENSRYKVLEDFNNQKDLDVEIAAVCDVFDVRTQRGITASLNEPKAYSDYRKLLKRKDIDAVVIATPDLWHARMAIDAAKSGKHVYLEKCMTLTAEEAVDVKNAIKKSGIIFQLGHQGSAPLWEVSAEEFGTLMDVNVDGTVHVIRAFVPAMLAMQRGVIANLSSGWGRSTSPEVAPYCASKFAVEGLTKALAQELPEPLSAVAVSPGVVNTEMLQQAWGEEAAEHPPAESWGPGAARFFLALNRSHNGHSLTI